MFHVCFGGLVCVCLIPVQYVALALDSTDVGPVTGQCQFVLHQ